MFFFLFDRYGVATCYIVVYRLPWWWLLLADPQDHPRLLVWVECVESLFLPALPDADAVAADPASGAAPVGMPRRAGLVLATTEDAILAVMAVSAAVKEH